MDISVTDISFVGISGADTGIADIIVADNSGTVISAVDSSVTDNCVAGKCHTH